MRFLVIRKADTQTEAGAMPSDALVDAMMAYTKEMMDAGVLVSGDGLKPSAVGARVQFRDGVPHVVDGPFAETKELVAGFSLIEVASRDEALAWLKRWPVLDGDGNVALELREVYEAGDFGDHAEPAIRAQEARLRQRNA